MTILAFFKKHQSLKKHGVNILFVFIFAAIIIISVLSTVLPSRKSKQTNEANTNSESTTNISSIGSIGSSSEKSVEKSGDLSSIYGPTGTAASTIASNNIDSSLESTYVPIVNTLPTTEVVNVNTGLINADTYIPTTDFTSVAPAVNSNPTNLVTFTQTTNIVYSNPSDTSPISNGGGGNNASLGNAVDNINLVPPLWGLTYSPYNTDGTCSDFNTVADQLLKIATVASNVRLYSTDCSQLSNVLEAVAKNNIALGIYVGIWVSSGASRMQLDLDQFVVAAKHYDSSLIKGVSVGNEDIFKGMSESTLIGYINQVRARLQAEGMGHIPVYTTETDAHFSRALVAVSDIIEVNLQVIFDSSFASIDASAQSAIQRANNIKNNIAGKKPVRIGECGWSSAGNTGPCPLSLANEVEFARKFKCKAEAAGYEYFYFEAKNAMWKQGAPVSEQNFGIFDASFVPKFDFSALSVC